MSKEYRSVCRFNQSVLGIAPRALGSQPEDEVALSLNQLLEEVTEFRDAYADGDFVGGIDAMIDLQIFSMGILYKMGLTEEMYVKIFRAVMGVNNKKKAGVKAGREGFKAVDAVKPESLEGPEDMIADILADKEVST